MRSGALAVLAAATCLVCVAVAPSPAAASEPRATLISVDEIRAAEVDRGRQKGGQTAANCTNAGAATDAYAFTGWRVAGPTVAHLTTGTVPRGLRNAASTLQAAFDVWRQHEPTTPRVTVATDGRVKQPTANHSYDVMFGRASGGVIASAYTWRWDTGEIESDVVFNTSVSWFDAGSEGDGCVETVAAYDLGNVAVHEFGHAYGLEHPRGSMFNTMYAYAFTGETLRRSPEAGDIAGIRALY